MSPIDLFLSFANPIEVFLKRDLQCDTETAYDAVIDVLFSYVREPERYDPQKGRLVSYLTRAAKHLVLDQRRSRISRTQREQNFASVVGLGQPSPKEALEDFVEASRVVSRLEKHLKDERDLAALRLILSGERSTESLAQALGLDTLPREQMRREVKRHRDRLMKILERFGKDERDEPT